MFKKILMLCVLIPVLGLTGCASHVAMSENNRQSIKSIYVNPQIKKPEEMYFFASGAEFGVLGAIVAGKTDQNAIEKVMENNNIDIRNIVYKEWNQQLREKTSFKLSDNPNSDTQLKVDISMYGLSIKRGLSTEYMPVLKFEAILTRNKQIIWKDTGSIMPHNMGLPEYKINQIVKDPQKLDFMWRKAAGRIVKNMIIDMKK